MTVLLAATVATAEPDHFFLGSGRDGALVLASGQALVVNGYAEVTSPLAPGDTQIAISPRSGSIPIAAGDLVMILQTTGIVPSPGTNGGSALNLTSDPVGHFELARVATATTTALTLTAPVYQSFPASVTQVIRIPEYTSVDIPLNAKLEPSAWNGTTGGVLAFLATGVLTLDGELQASTDGFRGGVVGPNVGAYDCSETAWDLAGASGGSGKGEGIVSGAFPDASGRGYLTHGGGSGICHNSGGGGGGNFGVGGKGGNTHDGIDKGGLGGASLIFSPYNRLLLGGGGGAGQQNDSGGSPGGRGGGIIFVRASALTGTGSGDIEANGATAGVAYSDGAGGGGAGGTIHFRLVNAAACDDFEVRGGRGGSPDIATHGPGGGGAGGIILAQGPDWTGCSTYHIGAGANGVIQGTTDAWGALSGENGSAQVDTTAFSVPAAPTLSSPPAATNDATPTISGNTPHVGATVLLFINGVYADSVVSDASTGNFSKVLAAPFSSGTHTVFAHTELKGVHSPASATRTFTVDLVTPDTVLIDTPPTLSNAASDSFTFSYTETTSHTAVTFRCRHYPTGGTVTSYSTCASPLTLTLPEGSWTFQVRARDAAGNIDAPETFSWTIDRTAPNTDTTTPPPAFTSQTSWTFELTATEANATFECRLDGAADFTPCASSYTTPTLSDGAHTLRVRARDAAGNADATPLTVDWTVDTVAPETGTGNPPPSITNQTSWTFELTATEANATFECRLDTAADFTPCAASYTTPTLSDGAHTLWVRARDPAGNTDATPLAVEWTVDTVAPDTGLGNAPPSLTNQTSWTFDFTSTEGNATFECRLDGAPSFTACPNPFTTSSLSDGPHTLEVHARDAAGNVDPTPQAVSWTVDATPPVTTIETGPPPTATSGDFTFTFNADEASTFECSLDGAAFTACTSPVTGTVSEGSHTFAVRAIDAAGNVEPTARTAAWDVDFPAVDPDPDGDGLDADAESLAGTSPTNPDTDADGVGDGVEVHNGATDPLDDDSDDDGILDGFEDRNGNGTREEGETGAALADTDGDGLTDGQELGYAVPAASGTDLALFAADSHPSSTTDPLRADTDGDLIPDGEEDADRDGARDASETDPAAADTDGDLLHDGLERFGSNRTDPLVADTDEDGLTDGAEDANANGAIDPGETDPVTADTDRGGVADGLELQGNTDPLQATDDYVIRGGCSAAGAPTGSAVVWLVAVLALRTAGVRRRARP